MGDCSICLGPIFSHDAVPSSSSRRTSTPRTAVELGEPLSVCALPCGHVYHTACSTQWFKKTNRNQRSCPLCRAPCQPDDVVRLMFTGDPWADERDAALKSSLGRAARRLADRANNSLGIDSHERAMAGFVRDVEGAVTLVKEEAEEGQEDDVRAEAWHALIEDPELKAAFVSLASSLRTLNGKLHYSHRITSLRDTISTLEESAASHADDLRSAQAAHDKAIDAFKAKTTDKVERERARWREKEGEREREWRGKEKSWEAKMARAEERVREEVLEKKKLREEASALDSSLNTRLSSLNSLKQANSKLAGRLELAKQDAAKLQDRIKSLEDALALAQSSSRHMVPAPWDEDEMGLGMDDSMEVFDELDEEDGCGVENQAAVEDSLEITHNDISWRSEPEVFAPTGRMRPFGQQPSKLSRLGTTSSANPFKAPPLRASPSVNFPSPPSPPAPKPSFKSGPRHAAPPPRSRPKPAAVTRAVVGEKDGQMRLSFSEGAGLGLELGPKKRRKIDLVKGVL